MGRFDFKTRTGQISAFLQPIFDADAQSFFVRVLLAGGTLTSTEQFAINNLVLNMKSSAIWDSMKAIYPMVGASAAACAQNLKSSSFTGSFTSGWTFASSGVTPNGTSAFMNTGLNAQTQLTQTNAHCSFYSRTSTDANLYPSVIGMYSSGATFDKAIELYIRRPFSGKGGGQIGSYTTSIVEITETDAKKFALISRISSTSLKYYTTGTLRATDTVSDTTGFGNFNVYLGAANTAGTASNFSILQCAFASIGDGLNDTQASNFYTAVQAFQTTLGRQV